MPSKTDGRRLEVTGDQPHTGRTLLENPAAWRAGGARMRQEGEREASVEHEDAGETPGIGAIGCRADTRSAVADSRSENPAEGSGRLPDERVKQAADLQ